MGLLLPAAAAARSSYEAAIKAAWLLKPSEPLERERRAAGYLAEEERFFRKISTDFQTRGAATAAARTLAVADGLAVTLASVKHQLSQQLANPAPVALPSVDVILDEQGTRRQYFLWRHISQLVHSAPTAMQFLKRSAADGAMVTYGFFAKPEDWTVTLGLTGEAIMTGAEAVAARLTSSQSVNADLQGHWQAFTSAILTLAGGRAESSTTAASDGPL